MTFKQVLITLIFITFLQQKFVAQQVNTIVLLKSHFTTSDTKSANTASSTTYFTHQEKQVILYTNLARIYPEKFALFYKEYLKQFDEYGYKKFKNKDRYYYTFYKDLLKLSKSKKVLSTLKPNKEMYELAKCWAKESGKKGVIGHNRKRCKKGYGAECCAYSFTDDALENVLLLLIDEGVKSLGHREILLDNYTEIGVSIQKHKAYGYCAVLDLN